MKLLGIVTVTLMTAAAVGGLVYALARRRERWDGERGEATRSPYSSMIAEKLEEHNGADRPILRAFEEALEHEAILERQLAQDVGLH